MSAPVAIRPALQPVGTPSWTVGAGAWDTHAHVFGEPERYPLRAERLYTPPMQETDLYLSVLGAVGVEYGVLVQPSVYGQDNSCLLDALDAAPSRLVGVVDVDVLRASDAELASMHAGAVRGLRVFLRPDVSASELRDRAACLRELGWHLDLNVVDADILCELDLATLGVPVMVEAMGSPHAYGSPGFAVLLDLLRVSDTWVKLSHAYHLDHDGPPYRRAARYAREILATAPEKAVWGSDWPHPMGAGVMPDDASLVDLVLDWADGDRTLADAVMCTNPTRFYRTP